MADERSPRDTEPVPAETEDTDQHEMNPVEDDEDEMSPGIVPPEGHEVNDEDIEATRVHESRLTPYEEDLGVRTRRDTQHSEGSTADPSVAQEQGLVYEPPTDPPTMPSDDYQGAEVAAGLPPSMEDSAPDRRDVPEQVDKSDWDLVEEIEDALRVNSETQHLDDIDFQVEDGVVTVRGTVQTLDDLGRAERVIQELEGVRDVVSEVELADESLD